MIQETYKNLKKKLGEVTLIAVTKYMSEDQLLKLYNAGCRDFGESRVDQLIHRSRQLGLEDVRWHFIGRIQSNKINKLASVKNLYALHAVDSKKVVTKLSTVLKSPLKIFIQVNTLNEEGKGGLLTFELLKEIVEYSNTLENINIYGLMAMSSSSKDNYIEDARKCFMRLKQMRDELDPGLKISAGMSNDYQVALEFNTNFVRLGSILSHS